jgi:hypothetical protein
MNHEQHERHEKRNKSVFGFCVFGVFRGLPHMKLQIDEGMWNGFEFYYFCLDRIIRIIRSFFACGEGPFGRRPYYPNDPVDPVQYFLG